MTIDRTVAERCVLRTGWLADQAPAVQTSVLRRARLMEIRAGEDLLVAGDEGGGVYGVVTGGVGTLVPHLVDGEKLARILRSGAWFGYGPFMRRKNRTLSFKTMESTVLLHIPLSGLEQIANSSPAHARAVSAMSEFGMDAAIEIIGDLKIADTRRRLATALYRSMPPETLDDPNAPRRLMVTQSQIGEIANLARDVVNRELGRLATAGVLSLGYRWVDVIDPTALQQIVETADDAK